jgi:hypothetical protein
MVNYNVVLNMRNEFTERKFDAKPSFFKFELPADCWSVAEIPSFGVARDEFK